MLSVSNLAGAGTLSTQDIWVRLLEVSLDPPMTAKAKHHAHRATAFNKARSQSMKKPAASRKQPAIESLHELVTLLLLAIPGLLFVSKIFTEALRLLSPTSIIGKAMFLFLLPLFVAVSAFIFVSFAWEMISGESPAKKDEHAIMAGTIAAMPAAVATSVYVLLRLL